MPHFLAKNIDKIDFPTSEDEFVLNEIYNGKTESIIDVKYKDRSFLLRQIDKNGNTLVKSEAFTRIAPVSIVKKAIKTYAKVSNAQIIFENLTDTKKTKEDEKFKNIDYFLNDFEFKNNIFIEVGFGSGRHLLAQAKANPDTTVIGLEIHTPSIEKVLRQVHLEKLDNILVLNYDARLFLEIAKSNSIDKIFVHFPVPWDKKEHRRIYSKEFINEAKRALKSNGTLELRTDSINYYEYVTKLFEELKIEVDIKKNQDTIISSKYEDRWKRQQKDIYDVIFQNSEISDEINLNYDFSFGQLKDFSQLKSLPKKPFIFDGFVVHFQDFFEKDQTSGLIKVSFGDFNKVEHKYIYINGEKSKYYQSLPVPSKKLKLAHNEMKKLLS
jgi:tRNA (guanine-N7-)-methyltransferase